MSGSAAPPGMSPLQRMLIGVMQRIWRASRGLRLRAEAIVLSNQGRVLVSADGRLPGLPVPRGEGAEAALTAKLQSLLGAPLPPLELVSVLAMTDEPASRTTTHIALFKTRLDAELEPPSGSYTFVAPQTLEGRLSPYIFTILRRETSPQS